MGCGGSLEVGVAIIGDYVWMGVAKLQWVGG